MSTESLPPYEYTTLKNPRSIRILSLVQISQTKRDPSLPLLGTLTEQSLNEPDRYVALSYSWDGQACDRPLLLLEGNEFRRLLITKNCEDALRRFRNDIADDHTLPIWIDAICINQSDASERNLQVSMMGDVYKNAAEVAVWLGEETVKSQKLFKSLRLEAFRESMVSAFGIRYILPLAWLIKRIWRWRLRMIWGSGNLDSISLA